MLLGRKWCLVYSVFFYYNKQNSTSVVYLFLCLHSRHVRGPSASVRYQWSSPSKMQTGRVPQLVLFHITEGSCGCLTLLMTCPSTYTDLALGRFLGGWVQL